MLAVRDTHRRNEASQAVDDLADVGRMTSPRCVASMGAEVNSRGLVGSVAIDGLGLGDVGQVTSQLGDDPTGRALRGRRALGDDDRDYYSSAKGQQPAICAGFGDPSKKSKNPRTGGADQLQSAKKC